MQCCPRYSGPLRLWQEHPTSPNYGNPTPKDIVTGTLSQAREGEDAALGMECGMDNGIVIGWWDISWLMG